MQIPHSQLTERMKYTHLLIIRARRESYLCRHPVGYFVCNSSASTISASVTTSSRTKSSFSFFLPYFHCFLFLLCSNWKWFQLGRIDEAFISVYSSVPPVSLLLAKVIYVADKSKCNWDMGFLVGIRTEVTNEHQKYSGKYAYLFLIMEMNSIGRTNWNLERMITIEPRTRNIEDIACCLQRSYFQ